MKVRFHAEARKEYHAAIEFYRSIDPTIAGHFVEKVEYGLRAVSLRPRTFPLIDAYFHRYLLKRFPFGIFYTLETDQEIVIWAVAHLSRKPDYWRTRKQ
jgi:toxin ParE1/3/4